MTRFKKALCLILALFLMLTAVACAPEGDDSASSSKNNGKLDSSSTQGSQNDSNNNEENSDVTSNDSSSDEPSSSNGGSSSSNAGSNSGTSSTDMPDLTNSKYFSTDIWQNVPMVSKALRDKGYAGGEGCQWMTYISFDQSEGKTAYACVDVGGIMKSTDGGKSWVQSAIGMKSHGSSGATVDPKNINRVIAIGADSSQKDENGLYLSTDQGVSWQAKCLMRVHGHRDFRRQVAFDETSYDSKAGYCKTIYWVTENVDGIRKGIYKSTDGGNNWSRVNTGYAGSNIAVHPKNGDIYVSNSSGLYKSTDGGKNFKSVLSGDFTYMAMTRTNPDKIFLSSINGFYMYNTKTGSGGKQDAQGFPSNANFLSVSPADANIMVVQQDNLSFAGQYNNSNYYSNDGGKTWKKSNNDYSGSFMPYNARQNPSSFHPTDKNVVIKLGGDFIMRSTDGGKNFKVSNDGNSAIYIGGKYNFNVNDTNILAVASQDYNGAFTTDGGKTWKYIEWGYGWGGYCYGAYALDKNTVVVGNSDEWYRGTVEIKMTFDGGNTVKSTGIKTQAIPIGLGALGNDKIAMFADHRTTDGGKNWKKMSNCTGVFCIDYKTGRLFGISGKSTVVTSNDDGASWQTVANVGSDIKDMAFDQQNKKLYVACNDLKVIDISNNKVTSANFSKTYFTGFAIDPGNSKIMYGLSRDWSNAGGDSVWRTVDGGKTWHTMNLNKGDGREGTPDGGRVSDNVRVNAKGEAFFSTNCRGMWKLVRPDLNEHKFGS